jgi:hypothetical protein
VPPSDPTSIFEPAPPSLAPLSQATAVVSLPSGRTEITPGGDPWTREFTDGDMEGPTVAVDGPLPGGSDMEATHSDHASDMEATHAALREDPLVDQQKTADLSALVKIPAPPPRRPSVMPPAPLPPPVATHLRSGESPIAVPYPSGENPIVQHRSGENPIVQHRSGESPIVQHRSGESPIAIPQVSATFRDPAPAQAWLPHQAPPPPPPPEAELTLWQQLSKPSPIVLAEIGLAALVLITLSIGGCLILRSR